MGAKDALVGNGLPGAANLCFVFFFKHELDS